MLAKLVRKARASPLLLFGAVWLAVGLPFASIGIYQVFAQMAEDERFRAEGLVTEGMVLSKSIRTRRSKDHDTTTYYEITYRFESEFGEAVTGTADIDLAVWDRLRERGPIEVLHLPATPWIHRIEGQESGMVVAFIFSMVGIVATAIGGFAVVYGWRGGARRRNGGRSSAMAAHGAKPRVRAAPRGTRGREPKDVGGMPRPAAALAGMPPLRALAGRGRFLFRLPGRWVLPLVGAVFFVVGSVFALAGIAELFEERRYAAGLIAEGRIVAKSIEEANRNDNQETRYLASYRFTTADGEELEGTYETSVEAWERLTEGDPVAVRYLPDRPQTNREADENGMASAIVALVMGPAFVSIGGGILLFLIRRKRRERRLLSEGIAAEALVLTVELSRVKINDVRQWHIRYSYQDGEGREREATSDSLPPEAASAWREGDRGMVRYDPQRPEDSLWLGKG